MASDKKATDGKAERDARLAAALRENLQRRKAQARARGRDAEPPAAKSGADADGDGRNSS